MKCSIVFAVSACALGCLAATNGTSLADSKVINRIRMARRTSFVPLGGYVTKPHEGKVIAVFNRQKTYSEKDVNTACAELRRKIKCPVYLANADTKEVGAEVVLCDAFEDGFARNIVAAPEEGKARVAVARLVEDSPSAETRLARLRKEILRAAAMSIGLGMSETQPCVMRRVRTLANLDAAVERFSPTTQNLFDEMSEVYGIEKAVVKSYRKACEEGWAPAPTNDVQKAVWDKVHALPTQPMKIEFDPKKGR